MIDYDGNEIDQEKASELVRSLAGFLDHQAPGPNDAVSRDPSGDSEILLGEKNSCDRGLLAWKVADDAHHLQREKIKLSCLSPSGWSGDGKSPEAIRVPCYFRFNDKERLFRF